MSDNSHLNEDICFDLLHDLLDSGKREKVLAHMRACPACELLFRRMVSEREHLRATWSLDESASGQLEARRRLDKSAAETTSKVSGSRRSSRLTRWVVAAASLAAVMLVFVWPQLRLNDTAELSRLPSCNCDIRFRTAFAESPDEALIEGLNAYDETDLGKAIALLSEAKASGSLDTVRQLYLGSALALDGRYEEAIDVLSPVAYAAVPDPWGSESRWTLFVAFQHAGRQASADSLLQVLTSEAGDVGQRARRRLAGEDDS